MLPFPTHFISGVRSSNFPSIPYVASILLHLKAQLFLVMADTLLIPVLLLHLQETRDWHCGTIFTDMSQTQLYTIRNFHCLEYVAFRSIKTSGPTAGKEF